MREEHSSLAEHGAAFSLRDSAQVAGAPVVPELEG